MKPKTIDEVCNQKPGTFRKFLSREQDRARQAELKRINRIKKARGKI